MSAAPVETLRGDGPLVLGMPHVGTSVPPDIAANLNDNGRLLADTDWHIDRLYAGLLPGATTVKATFHRYVIDANRDPAGESLYPGQNTTGLVPLTDFDGKPIWTEGRAPDAAEVARRLAAFHAPYHAALAAEVARVKARHGVAILFDCHSIRSLIPFLFEGTLPDLNIGTFNGQSCAPEIESAARDICGAAPFTSVLNGRFRGGWTTRAYGHPQTGVHAIQLEIAQSAYLAEERPPWRFDDAKAARLRGPLGQLLRALTVLAPALSRKDTP